eukprot:gene646-363_t
MVESSLLGTPQTDGSHLWGPLEYRISIEYGVIIHLLLHGRVTDTDIVLKEVDSCENNSTTTRCFGLDAIFCCRAFLPRSLRNRLQTILEAFIYPQGISVSFFLSFFLFFCTQVVGR